MRLNRIITILLFGFIYYTATAQLQLDKSAYKGFPVVKNNKDEGPNLMDIYINSFPSQGIISFTDNKKNPLNGCYHIIIHGEKYVIANIKKGLLEGESTLYWYNKVGEKAYFKQGRYDGKRSSYYSGEEITTYKEGIIQHHIAHYKNGQLKEELFYENGKPHGDIKEFYEDGTLHRESHYLHGNQEGIYMEKNSHGYTKVSHYKNGKLDGEYLEQYENGNIAQKGSYANDKKTGRWTRYTKEGHLIEEIDYLDDVLHGEKKIYNDNGILYMLTEYNHGKRNGKYLIYYSSNPEIIEKEENYKNNILDGITRYYSQKGILYVEILYRDGKEVLRKDYDLMGILSIESTYRNNNVIREKIYDKNGKLKLLRLANEYGSLVDVQEYNTAGKVVKTNTEYKKPASIKLKEDASGIIDIEIE